MKTRQIKKQATAPFDITNRVMVQEKLQEIAEKLNRCKHKSISWSLLLYGYLIFGIYYLYPTVQDASPNFVSSKLVPFMYFGYLACILLFLVIHLISLYGCVKMKYQLILVLNRL